MDFEQLKGKKIALLLSGGVDSAVVLHVLTENGIVPDCFYIKIGPEEQEDWDCTSEEDLEMANALCHKYKCRLEVIDCHREYWDKVTAYTMEKVRNGFTPNPDVMCNRLIKFGAFHEKKGKDYDLIATGHYAQTETDENGVKWLVTSPDPVKDQTDFLAQIFDWQLHKALFPIGHLHKEEVRRIAEENHLINAKRKDSQGICFLGKINYNDYIQRYLGTLEGDAIELETGKIIGRHKGHWFHTIGQRKGLGFGGGPWFVVKKDVESNIIYLSHGYNPDEAYGDEFDITDINLLSGIMPPKEITFKIRHTQDYYQGEIVQTGAGIFRIKSAIKIHGIAPGQFCVVYDKDHHRCFGSGEILHAYGNTPLSQGVRDRIKVALFDMDGVLYDSMKNHAYAYKKAGEKFGLKIESEVVYENEGKKGTETMKLVALQQFGHPITGEQAKEMYNEKCRIFRSLPPATKIPDVENLMKTMKEQGMQICVVTGSGQVSLLDRLVNDFPGLIDKAHIICAKDYKKGKPAPDPYLMGLRLCGVSAEEAIVIENAPLGVKAGKAAGIFTLAVNTGPLPQSDFEAAGASIIFNNMKEVEQWLTNKQE